MSDDTASSVVALADESTLSYALAYIRRGWWVFPLRQRSKQPDTHLCPQGHKDATNSPEQARAWWADRQDLGIGIALAASGLVCVDVDPRNGGMETLDAIELEHGRLDADVLALSGDGGQHLYYLNELGAHYPGKLGPGIDLKSHGYMVAPPSVHPITGRRYCWEDSSDPIQGTVPGLPPSWLRDMARAPAAAPAPLPPAPASNIAPERLASLVEALPHIDCNPRETWLNVGMAIHNEMPGHDGFELWQRWSQASKKFDLQDQVRVWRSFRHRGLQGTTINSVFALAQAAGWKNRPPIALPAAPVEPSSLLLDVLELDERSAATSWAVKGMVPDASLGMIFGASGTFKSFIALDYQLHRAWSLTWCGRRTRAGVTVFVAAEGGTGLIRRVKAWHLARGLDWRTCTMRVVIVPLLLLRQAQALAEAIEAAGIAPADVTIDTLSQTFDGNENAADEIAAYLRSLRTHLVERFMCTVTVIHHSGHGATERPRGSSALQANVDFLFGVFRQGDDSMVSTVECLKVKDGEKFKPVDFVLEPHQLGTDEDGEPITSLAASYVNSAEAVLKADDKRREGNRAMLLRLAGALVDERQTRKAFDDELADTPDGTRRAAWKRAVDWAIDNGMLRRSNGTFEVVRDVSGEQS
ncbi:MAG: hypothetical protein RLZZ524_1321 [Pseudomonadota bacterium]